MILYRKVMSRVKVKTKVKAKNIINSDDMNELSAIFSRMAGNDDANDVGNIHIIEEKAKQLFSGIQQFVLAVITTNKGGNFHEEFHNTALQIIAGYQNDIEQFVEYKDKTFVLGGDTSEKIKFKQSYLQVKNSKLVTRITDITAQLVGIDDLDLYWRNNQCNTPFGIPIESLSRKEYEAMYPKLANFYKLGKNVCDIFCKVEIDVEELFALLVDKISDLKKMPALSRCERGFALIKDSVKIFKDKFEEYNRCFLATGNTGVFLNAFIDDVAKKAQEKKDNAAYRDIKSIISVVTEHLNNSNVQIPNVAKNMVGTLTSIMDGYEKQVNEAELEAKEKQDAEFKQSEDDLKNAIFKTK